MGANNKHNTPDMEKQIKQNLKKHDSNFLVLSHYLIKITAKEIYSILISSLKNKLTSQSYFENSFPNYTFDWKQIYLLPRIITINSYQRKFQYKILYDILYLNRKLHIFGFAIFHLPFK